MFYKLIQLLLEQVKTVQMVVGILVSEYGND